MKYRSSFVTNSSSSSFILGVKVNLDGGKCISLGHPGDNGIVWEDDFENYTECAEEDFDADFEGLLECKTVEDFTEYLEDAIIILEDFGDTEGESRRAEVDKFLEAVSELKSMETVESIEIRLDHYAWGEFSCCIIINDEKLQDLAEKYLSEESDENAEALLQYMQNAGIPYDRDEEAYFGKRARTFKYISGDENATVKSIAEEIVDASGTDMGIEYYKINMKTGELEESYAELEI